MSTPNVHKMIYVVQMISGGHLHEPLGQCDGLGTPLCMG